MKTLFYLAVIAGGVIGIIALIAAFPVFFIASALVIIALNQIKV